MQGTLKAETVRLDSTEMGSGGAWMFWGSAVSRCCHSESGSGLEWWTIPHSVAYRS